jgi:hypothetical protein
MASNTVNTMGIDQYGRTYHGLGRYPRKELLKRLGYRYATKMFVDRNGQACHIGYVIGQHWITLYSVEEWKPSGLHKS